MAETTEIKETASVKKYNGTNFQLWKMHMQFIFQSRELWSIVNGTSLKEHAIDQSAWEKKDKTAAVAILNAISSVHRQELVSCLTSNEMWKQLTTFHEKNSEECIIALQEAYYSCKLEPNESIISYVSNLQKLARQLTDHGEKISDRQLLSKIKCGLPPSYRPLLLAWDSVSLGEQTLSTFQSRLVKHQISMKDTESLDRGKSISE